MYLYTRLRFINLQNCDNSMLMKMMSSSAKHDVDHTISKEGFLKNIIFENESIIKRTKYKMAIKLW